MNVLIQRSFSTNRFSSFSKPRMACATKPGASSVLRSSSGYSRCSSLNSALSATARFTTSPYSGRARVSTAIERCWSLVSMCKDIERIRRKKRVPRVVPWEPDYPRGDSRRQPAGIPFERLLEVIASGQHPARITFAVPPLHLLGTAVDDLAFTGDVDSVETERELIIHV